MGNLIKKKPRNSNKSKDKTPSIPKPITPVLPPKPKIKLILRALYTYDARDINELSFKAGDILYPIDDPKDKLWFRARLTTNNKIGFIPYNYIVIEDGSPTSLESYYDVDRADAERLLQIMGNPTGTFLIRPSADHPNLALSVRRQENEKWCVRHYMIRKTDNDKWYINSSEQFNTVKQLLEDLMRKSKSKSMLRGRNSHFGVELTQPLPRDCRRPIVPFKDLEVDRANFIKLKVLGRGNFGEVWLARWGENGRVNVAVKVLKPHSMSDEAFLEEARIMHSLRHHRIVELLGVCTKPPGEPILIISEYLANGSLLDFLKTSEGREWCIFSKLIDMMDQISEGMTYLESNNFIHRDLRAANILVDEHTFVKVADFGLARIVQEDDTYSATESKFPVRWTAPEASKYNQFTTKSDVWSFGVLIYEMITYGQVPYLGMTVKEVRYAVEEEGYRLPNPNDTMHDGIRIYCPNNLYAMMAACWDSISKNRPTFEYMHSCLKDFAVFGEHQYRET